MKFLMPTYYFDKVFDVGLDFWSDNGIKGILFDIDNTLEPYATELPGEKTLNLLNDLKQKQIQIAIISNNHKERVEKFASPLNIDFYFESLKPRTENIFLAIEKMGLSKNEVIIIGDQLFTDIWAGNRAGIKSMFVNKLSDSESLFIRLKRLLELPVVRKIRKRGYGKL